MSRTLAYSGLVRRTLAFALDYLLILAFLVVLLAFGLGARALFHIDGPGSPIVVDAAVFLLTVLPVVIYFALGESSMAQATWGKRKRGLKVVGLEGGRISRTRAFARAALKFLPWQVAHSSLVRIPGWPLDPQEPASGVLVGLVGAQVLAIAYVVSLSWGRTHRTIYDRICGTAVVIDDGRI